MPASPQISAVVANTGPIIALWLGEQITLLSKVLKSLHVPKEEVLEWKNTVTKLQSSRAQTPMLDVQDLIDQWTDNGFLIQYDLNDAQINRAERLNQKIHPGTSSVHLVDGYAVSLAQTLTDLGTVQALLADERNLRNVAKDQGLNVVGSLWVIRLLYESKEIDLETASAFPDVVAGHGQHYAASLIRQFRESLTQAT